MSTVTIGTQARIDYITAVMAKLQSCSYIDNPEKVEIGQTPMIDSWRDEKFPYIQMQARKMSDRGYGDTERTLDNDFMIDVQGFLRRPVDKTTMEDTFDVIKFHGEVNQLIYSLHDDIQNGSLVIKTFEQLGGFADAWFDYETFAKTSVFMFSFTGKFYQNDLS